MRAARGGGHKERLNPDINQTGHRAGRIIGVKGGKDQVTGQRRVDGDSRGFQVANFPQHDEFGAWRSMERRAAAKAQSDRFTHLHLIDAREHVFHRVFDRDNLAIGRLMKFKQE